MQILLEFPVPLWLVGTFIMVAAAAAAITGMLVVRESIHKLVTEGHNDVAGFFFATVSVVYAVLLAFLVYAVWERYGDAENSVDNEASAEINLLRLTAAMPQPMAAELQDDLYAYAKLVVYQEWPLMASGGSSLQARAKMDTIMQTVDAWQPRSAADIARYQEVLVDADQLSSLRNIVNFTSRGSLPDIFWYVLIGGGLMTVVFTWLFHMENVQVQSVMVGITAALLAGCLFLIFALNRPYAGQARITPDPFSHMLDHFCEFYEPANAACTLPIGN